MERKEKPILFFTTTQRFVHWLHVVAFILLLVTGMVLYVPQLHPFAVGSAGQASRLLHRIGVILLAAVPLIYIVFDPRQFARSMKEIFTWSSDDLGWLKAAPAYYFLGDEKAMPPQGKFNTGQKLFYLTVVVALVVFGVTGFVMWFGKGVVPVGLFQWSVFLHDLAAIATAAFFLVHFMLSVMHPLMKGSLESMLFGWISEEYVKSHHRKWYEEVMRSKESE